MEFMSWVRRWVAALNASILSREERNFSFSPFVCDMRTEAERTTTRGGGGGVKAEPKESARGRLLREMMDAAARNK